MNDISPRSERAGTTRGHFHAHGCTFTIPKDQTSRNYRSCFFNGSYEGAELEIFFPAPEVLNNVRLVIVEIHPWAIGESGAQKYRELLSAAGLRFKKHVGITKARQRD